MLPDENLINYLYKTTIHFACNHHNDLFFQFEKYLLCTGLSNSVVELCLIIITKISKCLVSKHRLSKILFQSYQCSADQNCAVDKSCRKRCPHCRFQKCIQRGMKVEG